MKSVTIYTKPTCPYCVRAKELFNSLNVPFEEIDVLEHPDQREAVSKQYNWMTVPMIFIGDQFVGGFDDVSKLAGEGKLGEMLGISLTTAVS